MRRLKASSLFETIVSLMVIVIVFGIAMTIYVNVIRNSSSLAELRSSQRLEEIFNETIQQKKYVDEYFTEEGIKIEKKIIKYKESQELIVVDLAAFDPSNRKLAERKEIVNEEINAPN